jgi:phosphoribosyl 1,2-cyclic phosphodiesterase
MQIQVLASSSAGNAVALHEGGSTLLLEAGIRFEDLQRGLGHRVSQLDACLISHEHGDHARSVEKVMRAGVDCYASAGTWNALRATSHRACTLTAGELAEVGGWRVLPFDVRHDAAEPLGFLIARGSERVLYLTDSAYSPYRFNGLTRILLESNYSEWILRENVENGSIPRAHMLRVLASHMSIERARDLLLANDLSKVEEIHLLHLSDGNSHADEFQQLIARATGKPIHVADRKKAAA